MGKAPLPSKVLSPWQGTSEFSFASHPQHNLVPKFMNVVDQSVVGVGFICMWTVVVASAGLDHHDALGKGFPVITAEPDLDSPGLLGRAAPAIHAGATVLGPVLLHTGASSISELHRGEGLPCLGTFLSLLQRKGNNIISRRFFSSLYPLP